MYKAREVADWLLAWADQNDADLSNLKLQKLLYYAQGHYVAQTGTPLFEDSIQAWAHGPVVPNVYHAFKGYGKNPIDTEVVNDGNFDWDDYRGIEDFMIHLWNTYASYAAWALREKTHQEAPWVNHFKNDERDIEIPVEDLRSFFAKSSG